MAPSNRIIETNKMKGLFTKVEQGTVQYSGTSNIGKQAPSLGLQGKRELGSSDRDYVL